MTDLFDRPVVWGESVAKPATGAATAGNDAFVPQTASKSRSVAAVASVAEAQAEAGRAIAAKVAAARQRAHDVAGVAGVAETEGERLERLLSQPSVATRATDGATAEIAEIQGIRSRDGAGVAPVATVAAWRSKVDGMVQLRPALTPYHTPWRTLTNDLAVFMGVWAEEAERMGWDTLDLFGVNGDPAHGRYDRLGLLILLAGRPIQCIDEDCAYIGKRGAPTVYRRSLRAPGAVPVWQWVEGYPQ